MDTTIKDNILNMYNQTTYSDKYGLDIWKIIILIIFIFITSSYYYILNNLQPIKNNWNEEKCNPAYIPFAGIIHNKKGDEIYKFTSDNFIGCTQTILEKVTQYAFLPFYYAINVIYNILFAVLNALGAIREMFYKLRNNARNITSIIFDRIFNITAPILEIFINIKSIISKFVGVITTAIYTLLASYLGLQSFVLIIIKLVTNILYILLGIIVALLVISWIPGVFPIALGFGAAMTALTIIVVLIQINMKNILNIQSVAIPNVPI